MRSFVLHICWNSSYDFLYSINTVILMTKNPSMLTKEMSVSSFNQDSWHKIRDWFEWKCSVIMGLGSDHCENSCREANERKKGIESSAELCFLSSICHSVARFRLLPSAIILELRSTHLPKRFTEGYINRSFETIFRWLIKHVREKVSGILCTMNFRFRGGQTSVGWLTVWSTGIESRNNSRWCGNSVTQPEVYGLTHIFELSYLQTLVVDSRA